MNKGFFKALCIAVTMLACISAAAQKTSAKKPSPQALETAVLKGVEAYDNSQLETAEAYFSAVLQEDETNDAAHFYMGLCRLLQRDTDAAEVHLKAAAELDPSNYWYRYRLASFYAMAGRTELTVSMYESLLGDFPKKSELYYSLVDIYISQRRFEDALATLDQLDTVFGKSESTAITRYQILVELQKPEEAKEALLAYNREYASAEVLSVLGDFELSSYRDTSALAYYQESLAIDPEFAPSLLGRAEVYRMTRKYDIFFPLATEFMSMESIPAQGKVGYLKAIDQRLDARFLRNFRAELDGMHEAVVSAHPADTSVLSVVGFYYLSVGNKEKADSCFKANVLLYPDDEKAHGTYCSLLSYLQDWDGLTEASRDAAVRFPDKSYFMLYETVAAYNQGDFPRVISIYQKIADSTDDKDVKVEAYGNIGDMYHQMGEAGKAYKFYDKALKLNPDYIPALNNYAYYLSLEGKKLPKAYAMSRKTIDAEPDNPTYLDTFGWILHLQGKDQEAKGIFKHAMLYGGKDSATILDHYAEVLFALKDYSVAFIYWDQALSKATDEELPGLEEKIKQRKAESRK